MVGLRTAAVAILTLALLGGGAQAQSARQDIQGARDHALVGRYEGSVIAYRKLRDYDEMRFPKARLRNSRVLTDENSIAVKGRALRQRYRGPIDRSSLEVVRNYEQKLKSQGFETLYFCRTQECGGSDLWFAISDQVKDHGLPSNWENQTYLLAELKRPEGNVYVAMLSLEQGKEVHTLIDVVETRGMETGKIRILDAAALKSAIDRDGRAALYGIQFEFDRAEIKPDSQVQISEIAAYLKANPSVAVVVTGHTDSKGGFEYNVDLSRRRAQAVVAALGRLGVPAGRLTAFGAGMAAPVASNETDTGQALNRRVEIVKR